MEKPTKAEIALIQLLDGIWTGSDVDRLTGMGEKHGEEILKVRNDLSVKYPNIGRMRLDEGS